MTTIYLLPETAARIQRECELRNVAAAQREMDLAEKKRRVVEKNSFDSLCWKLRQCVPQVACEADREAVTKLCAALAWHPSRGGIVLPDGDTKKFSYDDVVKLISDTLLGPGKSYQTKT